jgi:hypothetical protein
MTAFGTNLPFAPHNTNDRFINKSAYCGAACASLFTTRSCYLEVVAGKHWYRVKST